MDLKTQKYGEAQKNKILIINEYYMDTKLKEIIWTGNYRNCFSIENSTLCAKKLKPLQMKLWSLISHLFIDINQKEVDIYNSMPKELQQYMPQTYYIKDDLLISERPQDYDWWFSKTLYEYGKLENTLFWEHVQNIKNLILDNEFYLLDTLQWRNLLVRKISEDIYIPVIIDCKRLWWKSYPFQINLLFKNEKKKKINRIFQRLQNDFKI